MNIDFSDKNISMFKPEGDGVKIELADNGYYDETCLKASGRGNRNDWFGCGMALDLSKSIQPGKLYSITCYVKSAKDGEITAFLRLDMQNLGPVDVYVSLRNSAVRTKFTVADDEMIDFLYGHMDILNARLEKRGYSVSASVVEKQDQETNDKIGNVMEHILEENSNIPAFAHYSFDARA